MHEDLTQQGFKHLVVWTRGVADQLKSDIAFAKPKEKLRVLSVGRVSKEKNLDVLCAMQDQFDISVVGDGPYLETLKNKYKQVNYLGYKFGQELADTYAAHDVFAFPSLTDTFGIVMIEAMSNGLPVAGYNVPGPKDVIESGITGFIDDDLQQAIEQCPQLDRKAIQQQAREKWSWGKCYDILHRNFHA